MDEKRDATEQQEPEVNLEDLPTKETDAKEADETKGGYFLLNTMVQQPLLRPDAQSCAAQGCNKGPDKG